MPDANDPISVVEDLDPEPPATATHKRREMVLGITLVIGVLGFALWQWWRTEYQQQNYAAGRQAAYAQDWEGAVAHFGAAAGYLDADAQATDARHKIQQRDTLYEQAGGKINEANWIGALKDINDLQEIQRGFRNVPTMRDTATAAVYRQALSGTVALRVNAEPRGLYYRASDRWIYLPESDTSSVIRYVGDSGQIAYDVPRPGTAPTQAPKATATSGPGGNDADMENAQYSSRDYVIAHLSPTGIETMRQEGTPDGSSQPLVGENGIWMATYERYITPGGRPVRDGYWGMKLDYRDFGDTNMRILYPKGDETYDNSTLMDVNVTANSFLVATWSGLDKQTGAIGRDTRVALYLGRTDGSRRLLFETGNAGLQSAQFSDDGRYLLMTTFQPWDLLPGEVQSILLMDLQANTPPTYLAESSVETAPAAAYSLSGRPAVAVFSPDGKQVLTANDDGTARLWDAQTGSAAAYTLSGRPAAARFVHDGPDKELVIVSAFKGDRTELKLVDPAEPSGHIMSTDVPDAHIYQWNVQPAEKNSLLLVGQSSGASPTPTGVATIAVGKMGPFSTKMSIIPHPDTRVVSLSTSGDRAIIRTSNTPGSGDVLSLPVSEIGGDVKALTEVYSEAGTLPPDVPSAYSGNVNLGSDLLAYTQGGRLHARTYDGQMDVPLEEGIAALYDLNHHASESVLR